MNILKRISLVVAPAMLLLTGCEDIIDLNVDSGPSQLVVDGWITNQPGVQQISLSLSAPYFNNGPATPVTNASVLVEDNEGNVYEFLDVDQDGIYEWGTAQDTLGRIGRTYLLTITTDGEVYTADTEIRRVPQVDSVVYQKETLPIDPDNGPKEGYIAQFYARDFVGEGDNYWIKPVVDGQARVDRPSNISIAYDAAFNAGAPSDGLIFILPLRQSITTDSLYSAGNSVGVELHSITNEAFEFLKQVQQQASNGGLFATPVQNIFSNVVNSNPNGPKALGFFGASAVSRKETVIDPSKARPEE
ncbi:DUF4249 domain-containing protein [Dyadobacter jejuensis]|nr:DUF4249 domain-containing protein [Dyadobacter jejuensis]